MSGHPDPDTQDLDDLVPLEKTTPEERAGLQLWQVPLKWKLLAIVLPLLALALFLALRPSCPSS